MDAKTNIKARLPSRHVTEGPARAPHRSHERSIEFAPFGVAGVFKKTWYIADSKRGGRYVAKDIFEIGGIPLPMATLLDHGFLHGDCATVSGRTIAENLKSVKCNPHQDDVCDPVTVTGGIGPIAGGKAGKVSHADA
jgi:dihydroxy-acid dehydratase